MSATATGYLASKPRYEILDGLRGVAAMIVVAFHLLETYSKGPAYQVLNHGYLAVDFFFVLSGFVIGYAYDDRWNCMSLKGFFKRRLVRLHPMVIMGSLIGALFFYFGSAAFPMIAGVQWWEVLLICLLGCTMLPALPSWDIRGWGETSPLNGPAWSLLYEYIANILYALVIRRFPKFVLGLFVAGAAVLTLDLTLNLDLSGRESRRSARHGHFRECRDFPACRRSGLGLPETLRPARPRVAQAALADEVGCGSFRHTGRSPRSGGDLPVLRRMASAQRAEMPGEA